jgi:hypothetical protein
MARQTYDITTGAATIMSTDLNSLATGVRVLSAAWDNSSNLDLLANFELYIPTLATAPVDGELIADLWLFASVDGTNYPTAAQTSLDPPTKYYVGSFFAVGTGTGQRMHLYGIPIFPALQKVLIRNKDATSWTATLNTLKVNAYALKTV